MKKQITQSRMILLLIILALQTFAFLVGFNTMRGIIMELVIIEELAWFISGALMVLLQMAVFQFLTLAWEQVHPQWLFIVLAVMFTGLDATLTTIGAGQTVIENYIPKQFVQEDSTMSHIKAQLAADQDRLAVLNQLPFKRKYKGNTGPEEKEIATLQKRITQNTELITDEMKAKNAKNSVIENENNTNINQVERKHYRLAFITQIILTILVGARKYLADFEFQETHRKQDVSNQDSASFPKVSYPETDLKQLGNSNENKESNRIKVSPATRDAILKMTLDGLSRSEIEEKTGVTKGTISKVLYLAGVEMCKNADPSEIPEICEKLGIDQDKLIIKTNG